MRASTAYFDLLDRKKFRGPLDIRAPEDDLSVNHEGVGNQPIWSPAIGKALEDLKTAARNRVENDVKRAAKNVVDATSAYFRMSGVPVFAHNPVPPQLIKDALPVEILKTGQLMARAADRFVEMFDDSVRPSLIEQVRKHAQAVFDAVSKPPRGKGTEQDDVGDFRVGPSSEGPDVRSRFFDPSERDPDGSYGHQAPGHLISLDGATQSGAGIGARHATSLKPYASRDLSAAITADADDIQRSFGQRREGTQTVGAAPSDQGRFETLSHRTDRDRPEIQEASVLSGLVLLLKLGKRGGRHAWRFAKSRTGQASLSGALSVVAEWQASRGKPEDEQPWAHEYFLAFAGGFASGLVEPKWFGRKALADAGLAMTTSLAGEILKGGPVSVPGALGAGIGAFAVSMVAESLDKVGVNAAPLRVFAQGAGKWGKKYFEKYAKEFLKEVFGDDLVLTAQEMAEVYRSFETYWREQWEQYLYTDDTDPLF